MDTPSSLHLDAQSWAALRRREPAAVAHFARHLSAQCDVCEAFLQGAPDDLGLEALADDSLGALAGPDAGEELGWARVRRQLAPAPARRPRRWAPGLVGLAAAAALALVVVRVGPWREEGAGGFGIKGARPVALDLSAAAQLPDGRVLPVREGDTLPPEAVVLLRYATEEARPALLVTRAAEGAPRVLGRFTLQPGTHDLRDEAGELAGVSLEGEQGPLTVALVAALPGAQLPTSTDALRAALGGEAATVVVAWLHVQVQPGHTLP
ncbi:MAG TPA: hypothetical protein VFO83_14505 [Aggregicoccus sp.]|nr:hypothetical protein [Aggregicoccus sp.]